MRKFRDEGHEVFIATPAERRYNQKTTLIRNDNITLIMIKTLNIQKTNVLEKGLSIILIERKFLGAVKKYLFEVHFDLVLYSTPPITFTKIVSYLKQKDRTSSYLLLKDIFPQNAVDLGMIKQGGLLHRYFRKKEKMLYKISDHIGCMSLANVDYIRKLNPEINPGIVEVNPNSIEPVESGITQDQKFSVRQKYQIPNDATVFIYGGNLGRPQGIDFLLETLHSQIEKTKNHFIVVGSGTEFFRVKIWFKKNQPKNALLLCNLPKNEFDLLLQASDAGMIFLDRRFTIPNFPSRLLSYLEFRLPVIAATDKNTDLGKILQENAFGLWSEAGDIEEINNNIAKLSQNPILCAKMGQNGYYYMLNNYTVTNSYNTINKHFINV